MDKIEDDVQQGNMLFWWYVNLLLGLGNGLDDELDGHGSESRVDWIMLRKTLFWINDQELHNGVLRLR